MQPPSVCFSSSLLDSQLMKQFDINMVYYLTASGWETEDVGSVVRLWRSWNQPTLLVRTREVQPFWEDNRMIPQTIKCRNAIWVSCPCSGHVLQRNKSRDSAICASSRAQWYYSEYSKGESYSSINWWISMMTWDIIRPNKYILIHSTI